MSFPQQSRNRSYSCSPLHPDVNTPSGAFVPAIVRLTPPPDVSTAPRDPIANDPLPEVQSSSIKMKLVDAHAVQDLLTDNIDEHASHYVVFTDHGTLLSHDKSLTKTSLMKFIPFAGTVWRNHSAQLTASGGTSLSVGGLPSMKTLRVKLTADGRSLQQLTVEMEGMVSVMRLIIPRLLIAAQLESSKFGGETDEVSARMESAPVQENGDGPSVDGDSEGRDDGATRSPSTRSGSQSESMQEGAIVEETVENKPSKMRILELKAEGMAEFLADEYPAKLPNDFY